MGKSYENVRIENKKGLKTKIGVGGCMHFALLDKARKKIYEEEKH